MERARLTPKQAAALDVLREGGAIRDVQARLGKSYGAAQLHVDNLRRAKLIKVAGERRGFLFSTKRYVPTAKGHAAWLESLK